MRENVMVKILYQRFWGTYQSTRAGMQQILASARHKEGQGMIRTIGLLALVIMLMGCATIMHGSSQTVGISSSPSGARVTINGEYRGETPLRVELARKQDYIIKVEKEGFEPASSTITSKVSGMTFGNIIFGGLIGLAVDAGSGGLYKLSQDDVQITLTKLGAADVTPADVNILSPSPETSETPSITTAQEVFSIPGLGVTLKSEGEILVVGKVHPGGLGEGAGLQAGDLVTKIHGTPVTDRASLVEAVCARDDIWFRIITFKRANETINISFTPEDFECLQPTPSGVGVEGSLPEGEEGTTSAQEKDITD
jgi:membrane-associated protease RseP (regulator of RpoE activity)